MSPRIKKLKDRVLDTHRRISLDRSLYYLKSYSETEGEPVILRRARALETILENIPIAVGEDELIIGGRTVFPRMGVPAVEGAVDWLEKELDTIGIREQEPFEITTEDKQVLRNKIFPFFRGKTLKDYLRDALSTDVMEPVEKGIYTLNQTTHSQGHIIPDTEKWLTKGIGGLTDEVQKYRMSTDKPEMHGFYDAVLITLRGIKIYYEIQGRGFQEGAKGVFRTVRKAYIFAPQHLYRSGTDALVFVRNSSSGVRRQFVFTGKARPGAFPLFSS